MSSACLSGNRPYLLDLELVKSARASQASSPSSTLSESSNSPLAVSTRKPRAPRKRPNQTYHEAATILSTAYPHVFSIKHLPNASTFRKCNSVAESLLVRDADSLLPFGAFAESVFLACHLPDRNAVLIGGTERNKYYSSSSVISASNDICEADSMEDEVGEFEAGSMLEEEMEDGIDGIFGKMEDGGDQFDDDIRIKALLSCWDYATCPNPIGLRLGGRSQLGIQTAFRLRNSSNSPIVDVLDIFPKPNLESNPSSKKPALPKGEKRKNKAKEERKQESELSSPLRLKLIYDDVIRAWSGRGSPFSGDVAARLENMDVFLGNEGARDASVSRYKEKRRSRFFSKKIRYQVRKVNADRRPRIKGRFVRKPSSGISEEQEELVS